MIHLTDLPTMGPKIIRPIWKSLQYCEAGVKEGATLVYGGRQVQRPGMITSRGGMLEAWLLKLE